MAIGKGGMGHSKHRKSGNSGKSPKLRAHLKREAEKQEIKKRKDSTVWKSSIKDL